jgi:hypothetical protein
MAKKAISEKDWGRIYAFIWKKFNEKDPTYKDKFEKDPMAAIAEIDAALKAAKLPGLDQYDTLFDIGDPPADLGASLDEIIEGKVVAFLQTRLTC